MISSKLDLKDLKQAARLGRHRLSFWIMPLAEHHSWVLGGCGMVLIWTNLTGRTHESWKPIAFLCGLVVGARVLQALWVEARLRNKLLRLNAVELGIEVAASGVRFHGSDGPVRTMPWERYVEARAGSRVLLLFYVPHTAKLRRRKYLIVPLHTLRPAERNEVLMALPERLRSTAVQRELKRWRLA